MKPEWETTRLGEACSIQMGGTPARANAAFWDSEKTTSNVWLSIADLPLDGRYELTASKEHLSKAGAEKVKIVKAGTLVLSFKLSLGRMAIAGCDLRTNEAFAALSIEDDQRLERDYLFWALTAYDWDTAAGADMKVKGRTLNKKTLAEVELPLPPLAEQRRIVEVLDEAFAALATATANTQQALTSARELFESELLLVFSELAKDAPMKRVADLCSTSPPAERRSDPTMLSTTVVPSRGL